MSEHTSNVGKWDPYHQTVFPYGPMFTYTMGASWLADQTEVQDWGCGPGFFKTLLKPGIQYIGVDGSKSPNVDVIADLETYRSETPAIFMRHVLEHNWNWKAVLQNALASFQSKFFLVLFIPLRTGPTENIREDFKHADVPDLSFNREEFVGHIDFANCEYEIETIETGKPATQYGVEIVFKIVRRAT